jgi:hypothetical protein
MMTSANSWPISVPCGSPGWPFALLLPALASPTSVAIMCSERGSPGSSVKSTLASVSLPFDQSCSTSAGTVTLLAGLERAVSAGQGWPAGH